MRHLFFSSLLVFALAHLSQAQAGDSRKAEEKAAKKACAAGDFRKGIEILAGLYVDTDDTAYIYNQGRCYEQNHQWVNATDRFREYLRKAENLSPKEKTEVEKHITDCEVFLDKQEPKIVPPPAAPLPMATTPVPLPPSTPTAQVKVAVSESAPPEERHGSGLRVTGVVIGGLGAVGLATGLVLNLKANNLASEFNRTHNASAQSSQSSYKTGSMIGYGVGAGALLTGVLLYIIGRPSADVTPSQVSFLPVLSPTDFSLTMKRTF
jgi:hypothetical protein